MQKSSNLKAHSKGPNVFPDASTCENVISTYPDGQY